MAAGSDCGCGFQTVQYGHLDIHQNGVVFVFCRPLKCFQYDLSVFAYGAGRAELAQNVFYYLNIDVIVFCHQNIQVFKRLFPFFRGGSTEYAFQRSFQLGKEKRFGDNAADGAGGKSFLFDYGGTA